ncbi:MAG: GlsB/YeaQ/YmgE family stress response membrane protein [Actinobacteria bacterium]|nr:GlsB/YeaQ/YmgE family stress response membrane protein [Actinomycetota bacterium]
MIDLIVFIIVGLIIGALARLLVPGRQSMGLLVTILVGIVGAIVGGYLWRAIFGDSGGVEWIGSIIVAVLILLLLQRMGGSRSA